MGDTIWVDVRGRSDADLPPDNSIMLRLGEELDRLAARLEVSKLSDFYDYSVLEEEAEALFDDDGAESRDEDDAESDRDDAVSHTGSSAEKGSWFDAARGLAAVRAVRAHVERRPEDLGFKSNPSTKHWVDDLIEELKHCEATLEAAASRGVQFRFLIVP